MDDEASEIVAVDLIKVDNNATTVASISGGGRRLIACKEDMLGNFLAGGVGSFFYLQCVIGVLILVANVTVLAILIPKRPKCNQDFYLLNLLLAETLIYLVYYPLYMYDEFRGCWDLPYWLCLWKTFCARVFMSASAFAVCLIAYDRYLILQLGIRYDEYENTYKVWLRIVVFWLVVSLLFGGLTAADIALGGVALDAASQIGYCPSFFSAGPFPEVPTKLLMHCGPVVLCLLIYLLVLCRLLQRKNSTNSSSSPPQQRPMQPISTQSTNINNNMHNGGGGSLKLLSQEKQQNLAGHYQRNHTAHYRNHHNHSDSVVDPALINAEIRKDFSGNGCGPLQQLNNAPDLLLSSGSVPRLTLANGQPQLPQLSAVINSVDLVSNPHQHLELVDVLSHNSSNNNISSSLLLAVAGRRSSPHPQRLYLTMNIPFSIAAEQNLLSPPSTTENNNLLTEQEQEELSDGSSQRSSRNSSLAIQQTAQDAALSTPVRPLCWRLIGKKRKNPHHTPNGGSIKSAEFHKNLAVPPLPPQLHPQLPRRPSSYHYIEPDSVSDFVSLHYNTSSSSTNTASTSVTNRPPSSSSQALCVSPLNRQHSTRSLRELSSSRHGLTGSEKRQRMRKANKFLFGQHSAGSNAHREGASFTALLPPSLSTSSSIKAASSSSNKQPQPKAPSSIHRTRRRAMLKRASKTVVCITVAFFICWIPEAVLSVLMMSCFDHASQPLIACNLEAIWFGKQVSLLLVCLNAFINPIIYTLTMPDVKRRTARALRRSFVFRYCCYGRKNSKSNNNFVSASRDENSGNIRSQPQRTTHTAAYIEQQQHDNVNGEVVTSGC